MPGQYDSLFDDPEIRAILNPPRRRVAARPVAPEPPEQEGQMSNLQRYGSMAVRGLGGLFGLTPLTGAAAGAGSELVAEAIEQGDFTPDVDWGRVAGEAAAGAVGGKFAKMLGTMAGRPVKAAISGALTGAAAPVLRHGLAEDKWDPRDYATEEALSTGLSAVTGGALAKLLNVGGKAASKAPGEVYQIETTAVL